MLILMKVDIDNEYNRLVGLVSDITRSVNFDDVVI